MRFILQSNHHKHYFKFYSFYLSHSHTHKYIFVEKLSYLKENHCSFSKLSYHPIFHHLKYFQRYHYHTWISNSSIESLLDLQTIKISIIVIQMAWIETIGIFCHLTFLLSLVWDFITVIVPIENSKIPLYLVYLL